MKINLNDYHACYYSQFSQDGVIAKLAELLDSHKYFVEFGSSGTVEGQGNTPYLRRLGWSGLLMDPSPSPNAIYDVKREKVSHLNVNELFEKYIPSLDRIGLLSIDVDGQDYWIWKALEWHPDIVCIESNVLLDGCRSVPCDPDFKYNGDEHNGASMEALLRLGNKKGYSLVCICGVDMIFARDDLITDKFIQFENVNDIRRLNDRRRFWLTIPTAERMARMEWVDVP